MPSPTTSPQIKFGETYYLGSPGAQTNILGQEISLLASDRRQVSDSSGRVVLCYIVRNTSGVYLKGGRVVKWDTNELLRTCISGYVSAATDLPAGVIDDEVTAAGVAPNDYCLLVVDGPVRVRTPNAGTIAVAKGDRLIPAAGTSATNDDAGRVAETVATAATVGEYQNLIGTAEAAVTTNNTLFAAVVNTRRLW